MFKKKLFPELVVLLLAVLCVVTVFLVHKNLSYYRYASSATPFFMLKPDDVAEEEISEYVGVRRTYTFTIPESTSATTTGSRLTFSFVIRWRNSILTTHCATVSPPEPAATVSRPSD